MKTSQLLTYFDRICEAPDAIPNFRRFIRAIAVRGKLVEQDAQDELAAELMKLLGPRSLEPLFDLPNRWIAAQIEQVLSLHYGKGLPANERGERGSVSVFGSNGLVGYCAEPLTEQPAIIIGRKGSAGALNLCYGPSWTTDVAYFVNPPSFFSIDFLMLTFQTLDLASLSKGVKPGLSRSDVYALKISIPPLAEQHRIVAKVDELMTLCDRLEAAQAERERQRDRLTAVSLDRFNGAADADAPTFREHARFHLRHLPRLTARPGQIPQLRQTVLNLAVRGQLVSQDPNDEPASELLKRISGELERSVKEGRRKKASSLSAIDESHAPFVLPQGWAWARFPELGVFGRGKSKRRPRNDPSLFEGGTHLLVQTGDVARSKGLVTTHTSKYNDVGLAQSAKWPKGTLCITIAANIADSGILSFDACFPDSVVGFIPSSEFPSASYFEYFLRTAKADLLAFAPATAQKNINLEILKAVLIPIPPLAEQKRIVAKMEEILDLCDRLESQLTTAQAESRRLLEAVLNQTLSGDTNPHAEHTVSSPLPN